MRRNDLWHPRLTAILTGAGHGDRIVIADAGLPVPVGVETVDLLWRRGEPGLLPVVELLLAECVVESALCAEELLNTPFHDRLRTSLDLLPVEFVPHPEFKRLSATARVIVRTGEATPYANVALTCGVPF